MHKVYIHIHILHLDSQFTTSLSRHTSAAETVKE